VSENERDRGSQGRRRLRLHSECVLLAWRWRLRRYRCLGGGRTDTCWGGARSSGLENLQGNRKFLRDDDDVAQRNSSCALWVDCHVKDACVVHTVRVRSTRNKDQFGVLEAFRLGQVPRPMPHHRHSPAAATRFDRQGQEELTLVTVTDERDERRETRDERRETRDERRETRETKNGRDGTRDRDQEGGGRADMSPRRTAAHSVLPRLSAKSKAVVPHLALL